MRKLNVVLVFAASILYFAMFNSYIPITDPVESNYALTAKEMVENFNWLSPQIYGHYWFDKPIMVYWLIIICYKLFGITEFAARFPGAVFSAASVAFLFWFAGKYFSQRVALLSTFVLASSLEFWLIAHMVITDSALFFYNSVAMGCLYLGLERKDASYLVIGYAASGLAVLTKGPVGAVLPGLIFVVYILINQRFDILKRLKPIMGIFIILLVAAPWYFYMMQVHGSAFTETFLGLHNYLRATVSEHPEDNVFYYYFVLFPLSMLPWTIILFTAVYAAVRQKTAAIFRYLLVWLFVVILFYTLMATKYPTYAFPAMFPAALIMGWYLEQLSSEALRINKFLLLLTPIFCFALVAILQPILLHQAGYSLMAIVGVIFLVTLWLQVKRKHYSIPMVLGIGALTAGIVILFNIGLPLTEERSAKYICQYIPSANAELGSYGDYSTSAVFYSGYFIPRLMNTASDGEPQGVWAGKYTMPSEDINSFALRTKYINTYIIVKGNKNEFYQEAISTEFEKIVSNGEYTLYKRSVK